MGFIPAVFLGMGLGFSANGLWMIVAPESWYWDLPAAVPDFGPFNEHFIRDIGCAFLTFGIACAVAAYRPAYRLPVTLITGGFIGSHALTHVYDTARGFVGPEHWLIDLPLVYAPAAILVWLYFYLRKARTNET